MPGRLRVLRIPEALRACLVKSLPERAVEKIPQDIADRLCIFFKFSAIHRRKVARATRSLEITGSSVGVLGEEAYALAAGGLSGQAMPLPGWERGSFQGRCTHPSGRAAPIEQKSPLSSVKEQRSTQKRGRPRLVGKEGRGGSRLSKEPRVVVEFTVTLGAYCRRHSPRRLHALARIF